MKNISYHDSLYAPFGGFLLNEDSFSAILLKKRYTSVVYCPNNEEREPGAMYPRAIVLEHNGEHNGKILATFECYTNKTPVFPIYESDDNAKSWKLAGQVEDNEKRFGCRYQPHLYEMPCDSGILTEGTILCAGNIIPDDFSSTSLMLYKSSDCGKTWEYLSEIVNGGRADVDMKTDEKRPVWEPFLITDEKGVLYCFYSDEQYLDSENYNQALFHKKSTDGGQTWSEAVVDIAFSDGLLRPGMPVIAKIAGNKYIMVYEMVNQDRVPVYFRISDSLDDWGELDFIGNPVIAANGSYISGTPYVTWIPYGGKEGTILISGRGFSHIVANSCGGKGFWEEMDELLPVDNHYGFSGYSQCLLPICGNRKLLNLCPINMSKNKAMISAVVADMYERL